MLLFLASVCNESLRNLCRVREQLSTLGQLVDRTERERAELEAHLVEKERDREKLETRLVEKEREREKLEARLVDKEREREELEAHLVDKERDVQRLQRECSAAQEELQSMQVSEQTKLCKKKETLHHRGRHRYTDNAQALLLPPSCTPFPLLSLLHSLPLPCCLFQGAVDQETSSLRYEISSLAMEREQTLKVCEDACVCAAPALPTELSSLLV